MINNYYFLLSHLCSEHFVSGNLFDTYIKHNRNSGLVRDNVLKYGDDYYTNITNFYKLAVATNQYTVFEKLVNNLDDIHGMILNIGKPLEFRSVLHYIGVFNCFSKFKIEITRNPIVTFNKIAEDVDQPVECVLLFEMKNKRDAKLVADKIVSMYAGKFDMKGYLPSARGIVEALQHLGKSVLIRKPNNEWLST